MHEFNLIILALLVMYCNVEKVFCAIDVKRQQLRAKIEDINKAEWLIAKYKKFLINPITNALEKLKNSETNFKNELYKIVDALDCIPNITNQEEIALYIFNSFGLLSSLQNVDYQKVNWTNTIL